MSEENKEDQVQEKVEDSASEESKQESVEKPATVDKVKEAADKAESAARAAEEAEEAARAAMEKAEKLKAEAEKAAESEYKAIAEEVKAEVAKGPDYTFKRQGEEIFRRDLGEPEFFLDKKDRFPVPILSPEQQEELTRKAEIPVDNTPEYIPEHILSPEYSGVSNYESGVGAFLEETRQRLANLKKDPEATEKDIEDAEHNLTYLESLHENFYQGMNIFRTAKGGRNKIKK